jgi:hypothetical protein
MPRLSGSNWNNFEEKLIINYNNISRILKDSLIMSENTSPSGKSSDTSGKFLVPTTASILGKGLWKAMSNNGSDKSKTSTVPPTTGGTAAVRSVTPGAVSSEPSQNPNSASPKQSEKKVYSPEPPELSSAKPSTPEMVSILINSTQRVHDTDELDINWLAVNVLYYTTEESGEKQLISLLDLFKKILEATAEPILQPASEMCQCRFCQVQIFLRIFGEIPDQEFDLQRLFFRMVFDTMRFPDIPGRIFNCLKPHLPSIEQRKANGCKSLTESQSAVEVRGILGLQSDPTSQLVFLLQILSKMLRTHFGIFRNFRSIACPCSGCYLTDVESILLFLTENINRCQSYFSRDRVLVAQIVVCLVEHQERLQADLQSRRNLLRMMFGGFDFARGGSDVQEQPIRKDPYPGISGRQDVSSKAFPTECSLCAEPAVSEKGIARKFVQTNCNHVSCETCSHTNWDSGCKNYNLCPVCRAQVTSFTLLEKLDDPEKNYKINFYTFVLLCKYCKIIAKKLMG